MAIVIGYYALAFIAVWLAVMWLATYVQPYRPTHTPYVGLSEAQRQYYIDRLMAS